MNLFVQSFKNDFAQLKDENVKIVFSGRKEPLPKKVLKIMDEITKDTINNNEFILNICINYGSQTEIIDAVKKINQDLLDNKIIIEEINDELFSKYLYNDLPPLDFLIRTSGELRLSNFMLWQSSYAELYFPKVLFPDFNNFEFDKALMDYSKRERRFGGIKYEN